MKTYGLIGFPLEHSFSKDYFTKKFEREQIPETEFLNFSLEDISGLPRLLQQHPGLLGLAVTIPHKEKILAFADRLSEEVKEIGAANCLRIEKDGCTAFNTDIKGFRESLNRFLNNELLPALILGSGGASKAVEYVLRKEQVPFLSVSRYPKGEAIAYKDLHTGLLKEYPLIVNCTPLGMYPETESCPPIPYERLTAANRLFDLVYNPSRTQFLLKGEAAGCKVHNGLEMLEIQAEANWEIWNAR
jgi:shikimate dehydrogenase